MSALIDRVADSEFSFVLYYAPWDADCQAMKEELENVAQYYHTKVKMHLYLIILVLFNNVQIVY